MSRLGSLDLSALPLPDALETVNWKDSVAALKATLLDKYPDAADVIDDHLEPLVYLIENFATREVQLRLLWNEKVRAVLLPTAQRNDLSNVAAAYNVSRKVLVAADPANGVAEVLEGDDDFRERVQLAPEAFATTGSREAYKFHALTAHPYIKKAQVYNHSDTGLEPGTVQVVILTSDPQYDRAALDATRLRLSREDIRPMTDQVEVRLAERHFLDVDATQSIQYGPSAAVVVAGGKLNLVNYFAEIFDIGQAFSISGLYGALHVPGVRGVRVAHPLQDIDPGPYGVLLPGSVDIKTEIVRG